MIHAFCQICGKAIPPGTPVRRQGMAQRAGYPGYHADGIVHFDGVVCREHDTPQDWMTIEEKARRWQAWTARGGLEK